jgi:hypothetical protein
MPLGWGIIGDPPDDTGDRGWRGVAAYLKALRMYGHPEPLGRAADAMEATNDAELRSMARYVRLCEREARHALTFVEGIGYKFDRDRGTINRKRDARIDLMVDAVLAAFTELEDKDQPYAQETTAAIRERLLEYPFDPQELTHVKLKSRLQQGLRRRDPTV